MENKPLDHWKQVRYKWTNQEIKQLWEETFKMECRNMATKKEEQTNEKRHVEDIEAKKLMDEVLFEALTNPSVDKFIGKVNEKFKEKDQELKVFDQANKKLKKANRKLRQEKEKLQQRNDTQAEMIDELREDEKKSVEEKIELREHNEELLKANGNLSNSLMQLRKENDSLQANMKKAKQLKGPAPERFDLKQAQITIWELEKEIRSLRSIIKEQDIKLDNWRNGSNRNVINLNNHITKLQKEIKDKDKMLINSVNGVYVAETKQKLSSLENRNKQLLKRVDYLNNIVNHSTGTNVASLKAENRTYRESIKALNRMTSNYASRIKDLENSCKYIGRDKEVDNILLFNENKDLKKENQTLKEGVKEANDFLADLRTKNEQLKAMSEVMEESNKRLIKDKRYLEEKYKELIEVRDWLRKTNEFLKSVNLGGVEDGEKSDKSTCSSGY